VQRDLIARKVKPCEPALEMDPEVKRMRRKILIIDGHPDPDRTRFCHALAEAYAQGAISAGDETRSITLGETEITFLRTAEDFAKTATAPAIVSAQRDIEWADHIVIVFPLWLGGAPALLRAFLEQVACGSFFAETSGKGIKQRLKNKSARLIVTMGMPAFVYRLIFQAHGVKNIMEGVLGFAGFRPVRATLFGAVETQSAKVQKARLAQVRDLGRQGR
jgi:putative NADPH-quinone reductase